MLSAKRLNALRLGYRSGLEQTVAEALTIDTRPYTYESIKIEWEDLAYRTYTPDFVLHNNIIVETKGFFTSSDRRKHLCVKLQHPKLDIRFVFTNSKARLYKKSKSTYATWCVKKGFLYSDTSIPEDWLEESLKEALPPFTTFPVRKKTK
jgi:hypothetical protein|tara:strand:+ start:1664 stop:2113 length:450 start_codon:yes stop_codon:yes gene_type:complete